MTLTTGDFDQAVTAVRAQLARAIDKSPGVGLLANRLDADCEGYSPITIFGAVVTLLHKVSAVLVDMGERGVSQTLPPIQRRAIAHAAVTSMIFAALAATGAQPIEDGATVAGPETQQ